MDSSDEPVDVGTVLAQVPYHARWWALAWTSTFFAVCGAVITYNAFVEDDAMLWVLAVAAWGFVGVVLALGVRRVAGTGEVVVGTEGLVVIVPGRFQSVRFDEITRVERQDVHGQIFLRLDSATGPVTLAASMLPHDRDFAAIERLVISGEWLADAPPIAAMRPPASPTWMGLVMKVSALLSFCGGPLWVTDQLEPLIGQEPAFAITFAPIAVAVFATFSLVEDERTKWTTALVVAGAAACAIVVIASIVALTAVLDDPTTPDRSLILFGSAVSVASALLYARLTSPFLRLGQLSID